MGYYKAREPSKWVKGIQGKALHVAKPTEYVDLADAPALNKLVQGSYTLAAWFQPDDRPPANGQDRNYSVVAQPGCSHGLSYSNDTFGMLHYLSDKPRSDCSARPPIRQAASTTSRKVRIYVNGDLQNTKLWAEPGPPKPWTISTWKLGIASPTDSMHRFAARGTIDEVRIYRRVLNELEIKAIARLR